MRSNCLVGVLLRGLCLASASGLVACSEDEVRVVPPPEEMGNPLDGQTPGEEAVYAMISIIRTEDSATSYVQLASSLDEPFSLSAAREFPGFADIAAVNGQLLIGSGDEPRVTRYQIGADLTWEEGESLSFANQGLDSAGFSTMWFANDQTAYAVAGQNIRRVAWDPSAFEIRGVYEDTSLPLERDGYDLWFSNNRESSSFRWNGPVLRPYSYYDADDLAGPVSQIAAYDPATHLEVAALEAPCADLSVSSQDEQGNTYFSTWFYNPTLALYGDGPAPCVVRIKPDLTLDEAFTTDFTQLTGGRYVKVFRYIAEGKAIATVLDHESLDVDFSGEYDEDVDAAIWEADHWRLWMFDLEAGTAQPISGVDTLGSTFMWARFGERTFVFQRHSDVARTKVYEINLDGTASERFDTEGWFYDWVRVR